MRDVGWEGRVRQGLCRRGGGGGASHILDKKHVQHSLLPRLLWQYSDSRALMPLSIQVQPGWLSWDLVRTGVLSEDDGQWRPLEQVIIIMPACEERMKTWGHRQPPQPATLAK